MAFLSLAIPSVDNSAELFAAWTVQHSRTYTPAEAEHRFGVWKDNLDFVTQHNELAAQGIHSFTTEMNRFTP